ncbi:MAG: hypothetical protein WBD13_03275 [Burkholderiaceae bacterium]
MSVRSVQAGYIVVGDSGRLLDVSPTTTLRRTLRVFVGTGLALWLLSLTGIVIA